MKLFVVVLIAIGSVSLLGCADDKPAPKPAATTAATAAAKPAPSAAKPAGGW